LADFIEGACGADPYYSRHCRRKESPAAEHPIGLLGAIPFETNSRQRLKTPLKILHQVQTTQDILLATAAQVVAVRLVIFTIRILQRRNPRPLVLIAATVRNVR